MGCDEPAAVDTVTARRSGMRRLRRSSPRAVQAWSGRVGNLGVVRATRGKRSPGLRSHALLAFVHRYNRTARPFNWKFTADDLTAPLRRISQREQSAADQQATLSQAA